MNLGKNMMLDTWDGQIWYPRFYDMDTICSYNNSGEIKFDVDIEMEQGYWNTSSSRLWTKVRDYMHDELVETYKDMRQNGMTFDSFMECFYGDQISKIPQKYYNKDYDVKYAPYSDQYIGKAHGDGYQHLKRWLKNRLIFTDTLFDYAPSYENDVLTIRANTLDKIDITIETYTPVYQHLSWYNGQMSKEKIVPGQSFTFSGNVQASTDQEILIYGGSNIKKITGISSANPNELIIGNAPRLTELVATNCPLLTTINSNKANLSAHTYLNKLDLSGCSQLGGILQLHNSQLIQDINMKDTAITGLQMPKSLRNLKVLRLPNTITELVLNDAPLLHTIELDEGNALQSISLLNCNKLDNCINFDLTKVPTISLDNSYNAEELYMSETTNLTLKNMPLLKRVIFTPNSEYSEFDINNIINGKNYKITTFNNPMMTDFITTAPHRLSYNNSDVEYEEIENTTTPGEFELLDGTYVMGGYWADNGNYTNANNMLQYTAILPSNIDITSVYIKTRGIASGQHVRVTYFKDDTFLSRLLVSHDGNEIDQEIDVPTNCNKIIFVCDSTYMSSCTYTILLEDGGTIIRKDYGDISPNTAFTANTLDLADTQFTDIKFLCTTDVYNLKVPTSMKNFYCDSAFDIDTDVIEDASYEVIHEELIEPYTTNYEGEVSLVSSEAITESITSSDERWTTGVVIQNINNGEISLATNCATTDYIKIFENIEVIANISVNTTYIGVIFYNESKNIIGGIGTHQNSKGSYIGTSPQGTRYMRISITDKQYEVSLTYYGSRTPNIIPSSASGSLIFNMYSNNTTQPTSTSPYMWDLTGLKLNDFYTYGMNNWVKPGEDSYHTVPKYKLPIMYNVKPSGTVGSTLTLIKDVTTTTHCLRVNEGEKYTFTKLVDAYYYALSYVFTDSNGVIISIDGNYNWNNTKLTVPSGATLLWVYYYYIQSNNKLYQTQTWDYTIGDGNYCSLNPSIDFAIHGDDIANISIAEVIKTIAYTPNEVVTKFEPTSITMPQRMPGYSVRLVNADITPDEYPTMLYPKLIDTTLPITGKLNYEKYNGTSLAWAYAYTTDDVSINPLDSRGQGNITNDYNKLYGTDFVDIVDVWIYKDTDVSKLSTNEVITKAYIELTSDNVETRVDEVLQYYPNCTDVYIFDDGSVTSLRGWYENRAIPFENLTFMEGYFTNLTVLWSAFRNHGGKQLKKVYNLPNSVTNMQQTFQGCIKLNYISNIPTSCNGLPNTFLSCEFLTEIPPLPYGITNMTGTFQGCTRLINAPTIPDGVTSMRDTFSGCTSLTTPPTIPNSVTDMQGTFYNCTSLTQAPAIPDGVTTIQSTFYGCTKLTQASVIGNSVTNMANTFQGCKALTIPPTIGNSVTNMNNTFYECTSLTQAPDIPNSVTNMDCTFYGCTSLTQAPVIGNGVIIMQNTFNGCTSLTTAPTIPNSVTTMANCFRGCTSLTTVPNIGSSVTNMANTFRGCKALTQAPTIPQGVTGMEGTFGGCSLLTQAPTIPNSVTSITEIFDGCSSLTTVTIPLGGFGQNYTNGLRGCKNLQDVNWEGELNASFSMTMFCSYCSERDIQELVPEHLADVTTNIYTIKNRIANINGLEFDLNSHQAYHVGNLIIGTNGSWGGYPNAGCGLIQKAILNGVEIIPILDTSGNPCFLNTSNGSLYYDSMEGTMTAGNIIGTYNGYSKLSYIKAENCYVKAEDIEVDINTHDLEYHLLVDASQSTTNRHCVNFLGSCGSNIRIYYPGGSFNNTSSNFKTGSATLTLGETYGAYLTPDEVFSANAKGWTIVGVSNDFTIINASDDMSGYTTDENVTSCFIELTNDNYKTRIDEVLQYYPNCTDLYFFDDGSVTSLIDMLNENNKNYKSQITNVVFLDGYFYNLANMSSTFHSCTSLTTPPAIPDGVTNMYSTFRYCKALTQAPTIPDGVTNMTHTFGGCTSLTQAPTIPQGVTGMEGTFGGCSLLTQAPTIPSRVNNMNSTFSGCSLLTQAPTIPSSVTKMNHCFNGCKALTTPPTIPNGVTTMDSCFTNCTSLTQAPTIPDSVTIMISCFRGCTSLTTVPNIGSSVTNMSYAFHSCTSLTTPPAIPSGVTNMAYTFQGCTSLTTPPTIPNSVTDMNSTFHSCTSLTTGAKILSTSITNITALYHSCTNLQSCDVPIYANLCTNALYNVPSTCDITWVGERTTNLDITKNMLNYNKPNQRDIQELVPEHLATVESATLTLGDYASYLSITEILAAQAKGWTIEGNYSMDYAIVNASTDLSAIEVNSDITTVIIELTNDNYKTRISEVYAKYPSMTDVLFTEDGTVTTLADMFNNSNNSTGKTKIKKIEFMDGYFQNLTSLNYAFYNCTSLTDVSNIPSSVENMYRAFYYCGALVNVSDFPDGVTNVNYTFYQCDSLVTAPKLGKSTTVMDYTFYGCDNLTSIPEFPPNVTKLTGTFSGCTKLNSVPKIPDGVTDMSNCFYNCYALSKAPALPASIQVLSSTFYSCTTMTEFPSIIPKAVNNTSSCFYYCSNMVTPPEFEHTDGSNLYTGKMFQNCSNLTSAPKLPDGLTNIQGMFMSCSKLQVPPTIPDSVTNMQEAFNNCTGLTQNPNVPTGVTNLKYAFSNSSITAITIPLTNLTTYDYAISKCPNLTDVTWVGELTSTFNVKNLYYRSATDNTTPTTTDIQELVPEHLGTVTGATLTLGDYISHLTEDEISQAVAKGWTIQ